MSAGHSSTLDADIQKYFSSIKMDRAHLVPARYLAPNIILRPEVNGNDIESLNGCSRALLVSPLIETTVQIIGQLFAHFGFIAISPVRGSARFVIEYQDIQAAMQALYVINTNYKTQLQIQFVQPIEVGQYPMFPTPSLSAAPNHFSMPLHGGNAHMQPHGGNVQMQSNLRMHSPNKAVHSSSFPHQQQRKDINGASMRSLQNSQVVSRAPYVQNRSSKAPLKNPSGSFGASSVPVPMPKTNNRASLNPLPNPHRRGSPVSSNGNIEATREEYWNDSRSTSCGSASHSRSTREHSPSSDSYQLLSTSDFLLSGDSTDVSRAVTPNTDLMDDLVSPAEPWLTSSNNNVCTNAVSKPGPSPTLTSAESTVQASGSNFAGFQSSSRSRSRFGFVNMV